MRAALRLVVAVSVSSIVFGAAHGAGLLVDGGRGASLGDIRPRGNRILADGTVLRRPGDGFIPLAGRPPARVVRGRRRGVSDRVITPGGIPRGPILRPRVLPRRPPVRRPLGPLPVPKPVAPPAPKVTRKLTFHPNHHLVKLDTGRRPEPAPYVPEPAPYVPEPAPYDPEPGYGVGADDYIVPSYDKDYQPLNGRPPLGLDYDYRSIDDGDGDYAGQRYGDPYIVPVHADDDYEPVPVAKGPRPDPDYVAAKAEAEYLAAKGGPPPDPDYLGPRPDPDYVAAKRGPPPDPDYLAAKAKEEYLAAKEEYHQAAAEAEEYAAAKSEADYVATRAAADYGYGEDYTSYRRPLYRPNRLKSVTVYTNPYGLPTRFHKGHRGEVKYGYGPRSLIQRATRLGYDSYTARAVDRGRPIAYRNYRPPRRTSRRRGIRRGRFYRP